MTRRLVTLPPDAALGAAVALFNMCRISCIPVLGNDRRSVVIVSWRGYNQRGRGKGKRFLCKRD